MHNTNHHALGTIIDLQITIVKIRYGAYRERQTVLLIYFTGITVVTLVAATQVFRPNSLSL